MQLRVLFSGVPIGTVEIPLLEGLSHGALAASDGYEIARRQAEAAGYALSLRDLEWHCWPHSRGDFAEAFAAALAGGYELADLRGIPIGAASVSVVALPAGNSRSVIADFRPDSARMPAKLCGSSDVGGGRQRPAA